MRVSPPWASHEPFERTLRRIADLAASRGDPAFPRDGKPPLLDETLRSRLPEELLMLLTWHDETTWSFFVNPERARVSDRLIMTIEGEFITPGHPRDAILDPVSICEVDEIEIVTPRDENACVPFAVAKDSYREYGWDERVLDAEFAQFASTSEGGQAYFVTLDDRFCATGSVVFTIMDDPSLVWVAPSIAAWCRRLLAFGGMDIEQFPGSLTDLPRRLSQAWAREAKTMNPLWTWWD